MDLRIKPHGKIARGARGARTESKQISAVHRDQGLALGGRRHRQGRLRKHRVGGQGMLTAFHHQNGIGLGGDDGFVVDDFIAVEVVKCVAGSRHIDDAVGSRSFARQHRPAVGQRQDESDLARSADLRAYRAERIHIVANHAGETFAAPGDTDVARNHMNLVNDAVARKLVRHRHERNVRSLQNVDRFLWS